MSTIEPERRQVCELTPRQEEILRLAKRQVPTARLANFDKHFFDLLRPIREVTNHHVEAFAEQARRRVTASPQ